MFDWFVWFQLGNMSKLKPTVSQAKMKILIISSYFYFISFRLFKKPLPIKFRIQLKILVIAFSALHGQRTAALENYCNLISPAGLQGLIRVCWLLLAPNVILRKTVPLKLAKLLNFGSLSLIYGHCGHH